MARAIEFALISGETWSERLRDEGTWKSHRERYASLKIGLTMQRGRLYERLDRRVDRFFEAGLIDEVRGLLAAGLSPEANALKAIGYREVLTALLEGRDPRAVREEVQRNTRRYAKRQLTWFRGEPGVIWLDAESQREELVRQVTDLWRERELRRTL